MALTRSIAAIILAGTMCASAYAQNATKSTDPLPRAKPEDVGMSSQRLAEIGKALNADIARGQMPGTCSRSRAMASSFISRRSAIATRRRMPQ